MNYSVSYWLWPAQRRLMVAKALRLTLLMGVLLLSFTLPGRAQTGNDTIVAPPVDLGAPIEEEEDTEYSYQPAIQEPATLRHVSDSVMHALKKQKDFAYANDPAYWTEKQQEQDDSQVKDENDAKKGFWYFMWKLFQSSVARTIFYALLIAFCLFVIYRIIVVNKLFLFYSSKKVKTIDEGEVMDIDDENLDTRIQKAIDANDYRMAVRFLYLKTLQILNDKQWIRFHADGTNHEYVTQMSSRKQGNDFRFLTRIYDYMWYGEFSLTSDQFEIVNNNFRHFYNAVNS